MRACFDIDPHCIRVLQAQVEEMQEVLRKLKQAHSKMLHRNSDKRKKARADKAAQRAKEKADKASSGTKPRGAYKSRDELKTERS